jgi:hypothetical protein
MGSIYRREGSPFYWISYYRDGLQSRESSGSDKVTKAKELLRKREGAIADGKPVNPKSEKIRFTQLAALVVDDYPINPLPVTQEHQRPLEKSHHSRLRPSESRYHHDR